MNGAAAETPPFTREEKRDRAAVLGAGADRFAPLWDWVGADKVTVFGYWERHLRLTIWHRVHGERALYPLDVGLEGDKPGGAREPPGGTR